MNLPMHFCLLESIATRELETGGDHNDLCQSPGLWFIREVECFQFEPLTFFIQEGFTLEIWWLTGKDHSFSLIKLSAFASAIYIYEMILSAWDSATPSWQVLDEDVHVAYDTKYGTKNRFTGTASCNLKMEFVITRADTASSKNESFHEMLDRHLSGWTFAKW